MSLVEKKEIKRKWQEKKQKKIYGSFLMNSLAYAEWTQFKVNFFFLAIFSFLFSFGRHQFYVVHTELICLAVRISAGDTKRGLVYEIIILEFFNIP